MGAGWRLDPCYLFTSAERPVCLAYGDQRRSGLGATIKLLREAGSDDDDSKDNATGQNQPSTETMSEYTKLKKNERERGREKRENSRLLVYGHGNAEV